MKGRNIEIICNQKFGYNESSSIKQVSRNLSTVSFSFFSKKNISNVDISVKYIIIYLF